MDTLYIIAQIFGVHTALFMDHNNGKFGLRSIAIEFKSGRRKQLWKNSFFARDGEIQVVHIEENLISMQL